MLVFCFLEMMVTSSTWHGFEPELRFNSLLFMSYYIMLMMLHFVPHPLNSFKTC